MDMLTIQPTPPKPFKLTLNCLGRKGIDTTLVEANSEQIPCSDKIESSHIDSASSEKFWREPWVVPRIFNLVIYFIISRFILRTAKSMPENGDVEGGGRKIGTGDITAID